VAVQVDGDTVGARLRALRRRRGLSRAELAAAAGLSPSLVSAVERGRRLLDRRGQLAAVAWALGVSETDLAGGPRLSADAEQAAPLAAVPALRTALTTNTLTEPAVKRARPLPELARAVAVDVDRLWRRTCDYAGVGAVLPDVLDELHVHAAAPADEAARRLALETLVEACAAAAFTVKDLGCPDLACAAALRAGQAAELLDDPVAQSKAEFTWVHVLPWGSGGRVSAAAERAAGRAASAAGGPQGAAAAGMLALSAALAAAVSGRGDAAERWLDEAAALAGRVPDDPAGNWQSFSATNVGVWRVALAVERGEGAGAVLGLAGRVDVDRLAEVASRRAALFADVGRGLARERATREEAVGWLRRAEDAAPQRIRNSAGVREAVAFLLDRTVSAAARRELRAMAARMGLPR
jgi:transcriptional regulator with XRE-family HTH domain